MQYVPNYSIIVDGIPVIKITQERKFGSLLMQGKVPLEKANSMPEIQTRTRAQQRIHA